MNTRYVPPKTLGDVFRLADVPSLVDYRVRTREEFEMDCLIGDVALRDLIRRFVLKCPRFTAEFREWL